MNSLLLLVSMLTTSAPAGVCPAPPVYVAVLMDDSAVAIRTDFTLAQIEAMRRQVGGIDRHPNLGFYGHRFGYTVDVNPIQAAGQNCVGSIQVKVHMVLSQRVIELGSDLQSNPCLFAVAEEHYRRHALADDRVFADYAHAIAPALDSAKLLPQQQDYPMGSIDPKQVEQRVRSTIDATLLTYQSARAAAQRSVDNKAEAAKMVKGCPPPPATGGHI